MSIGRGGGGRLGAGLGCKHAVNLELVHAKLKFSKRY